MAAVTISIEGFEQLHRRFQALAAVAQQKVLQKTLKLGSRVLREEMARWAPRRTGLLATTFTEKLLRDNDIAEASISVGIGKDAFYGYFMEFGTGMFFQAAAARALGYPGRSKSQRQNVQPHPFLRPALESKRDEVLSVMRSGLQTEMEKAARVA